MFATSEAAVASLALAEAQANPHEKIYQRAGLPMELQRKLKHLSEQLLPLMNASQPKAIVFGEVAGGFEPAFWLTQGLAAELKVHRQRSVGVLVVNDAAMHASGTRGAAKEATLRQLSEEAPFQTFEQRLKAQLQEDAAVLVHVPDALHWAEQPVGLAHCGGFVMVIRANRTRKAAIEALQKRLARLNVHIVGAVVLDREYPIPEALYRWL